MTDFVEVVKVYVEEEGGELCVFGGKSYKLKSIIVNGEVTNVYGDTIVTKQPIDKKAIKDFVMPDPNFPTPNYSTETE